MGFGFSRLGSTTPSTEEAARNHRSDQSSDFMRAAQVTLVGAAVTIGGLAYFLPEKARKLFNTASAGAANIRYGTADSLRNLARSLADTEYGRVSTADYLAKKTGLSKEFIEAGFKDGSIQRDEASLKAGAVRKLGEHFGRQPLADRNPKIVQGLIVNYLELGLSGSIVEQARLHPEKSGWNELLKKRQELFRLAKEGGTVSKQQETTMPSSHAE